MVLFLPARTRRVGRNYSASGSIRLDLVGARRIDEPVWLEPTILDAKAF